MSEEGKTPPLLPDDCVVFRAYTRALNEHGRAKDIEFRLRDSEQTLSLGLTPQKAMGQLDCKGVVPLTVGAIRKLGQPADTFLDVVVKSGAENPDADPELLEVVGIPEEEAVRLSLRIEFARVAGTPLPKSR